MSIQYLPPRSLCRAVFLGLSLGLLTGCQAKTASTPSSVTVTTSGETTVDAESAPPATAGEPASETATPPAVADDAKPAADADAAAATKDTAGWKPLFDGKSLAGWKKTEFGGEGDVTVEDGTIVIDIGSDISGITWTGGELPKMDYEISVEAKRVEGSDFFCGLTFPVGKDPCSLILGGWGGGTVGLSSIDGLDASENATTQYQEFKNGRWYTVRLRVSQPRIEAWIDKEKIIDQELADRRISIRAEMELSKPLGFATYATRAALRNIKIRPLAAAELEKPVAEGDK